MRLTLTPSRNLPSWTPHSSTIPQIVLFAARALKYGIVANAPSITARTISNVPILWISALTIVPTPRNEFLLPLQPAFSTGRIAPKGRRYLRIRPGNVLRTDIELPGWYVESFLPSSGVYTGWRPPCPGYRQSLPRARPGDPRRLKSRIKSNYPICLPRGRHVGQRRVRE